MNNDTQFLVSGHSLKKISSKISSLQATKKIKQHCYLSISGPRPFFKKISSKISSLQATQNKPFIGAPKFFHNILMLYTEKCVPLYATRVGMT